MAYRLLSEVVAEADIKNTSGVSFFGLSRLENAGDVSITNIEDGQSIKWNATTSKWVNATLTEDASSSSSNIAKRYVEIIAVHKTMNVLNRDSIINSFLNNIIGHIVNVYAYTQSGSCNLNLIINGTELADPPISVTDAPGENVKDIELTDNMIIDFKTTNAGVDTFGLVIVLEIDEVVELPQSKITRYLQCPAVHRFEAVLQGENIINAIFVPFDGNMKKISCFTASGSCVIKIRKNNELIDKEYVVTSSRTTFEELIELLRLDTLCIDVVSSTDDCTGLNVIFEIEEI